MSSLTRDQLRYLGYLALAAAILAVLAVLGRAPMTRWAGDGTWPAMLWATAASFVASVLGSIPVALFGRRGPQQLVPAAMGSIGIRLVVLLTVALAGALSGRVAPAPFLVWLAISHAALLVADTVYALGSLRAAGTHKTSLHTETTA